MFLADDILCEILSRVPKTVTQIGILRLVSKRWNTLLHRVDFTLVCDCEELLDAPPWICELINVLYLEVGKNGMDEKRLFDNFPQFLKDGNISSLCFTTSLCDIDENTKILPVNKKLFRRRLPISWYKNAKIVNCYDHSKDRRTLLIDFHGRTFVKSHHIEIKSDKIENNPNIYFVFRK